MKRLILLISLVLSAPAFSLVPIIIVDKGEVIQPGTIPGGGSLPAPQPAPAPKPPK